MKAEFVYKVEERYDNGNLKMSYTVNPNNEKNQWII